MKISFIYLSNRLGSIDILGHSLHNFAPYEGVEWELVVADGVQSRYNAGAAFGYLSKLLPVPVTYVRQKPPLYPNAATGFCSAMNTGLLHATGSHVVFLHDYTSYTPTTLQAWALLFNRYPKTLISGTAIMHDAPEPDNLGDITTWKSPPAISAREPWVPGVFELGYWGGPMEYFELTNGIDERGDFRADWGLASVINQARIHDYALYVERHHYLTCHMVDHRAWHKEPHEGYVHNSQWKTYLEVKEDLPEPAWGPWSFNAFNLKEQRRNG